MISVILDAESIFQLSLGLNLTGSAKGELSVSEEALQALEDLKWNNIHVIGKDGKKILLSNKTFAEDSLIVADSLVTTDEKINFAQLQGVTLKRGF